MTDKQRQLEHAVAEFVAEQMAQHNPACFKTLVGIVEQVATMTALQSSGLNQTRATVRLGVCRTTLRKHMEMHPLRTAELLEIAAKALEELMEDYVPPYRTEFKQQ